ncbi:phosphatidylserine decarboxylase [Wolbachia endosymbiont of Dirofilaria (Dirofilaria) immitis]|uniref:phosphatidylserine decarboxylase n=1 Tax=Wolbachia endosymbiont of Dirofilaria (Dirofilaria) immitis TaxID=1812115 RepID=UPI00158BD5C1|nr:phosphatidylserine decarboxylase [Wolbachia endosymbiont of Dirofilaria (Dirofilaria) immitis]QKX02016.1 phosphatidylserine decarboxylase [Wolbachia endosymbiont of Dirofilaria (Dirofilaria) immitis]
MCFRLPNINREGYLFIVISFIVTCIAFPLSWRFSITCLLLTLLCTYFFRDPARAVPSNRGLILSPADGIISKIEEVSYPLSVENKEEKKFTLISIFLSILNVHVNRIPISGTIKEMHYKKGKFVSAMRNRSSNENEKQVIVIEYEKEKEIIVEQIAGLVARRIICNLKVFQDVKAGERFGIIRFGSRVNIYVPADTEIRVSKRQTVVGGETIIANLNKKNTQEKLTFDII